jgi:hypothetical protein
MPFPRKEPDTKLCQHCGTLMIQPRWANGKLDGTFRRRRFCSLNCNHEWLRLQAPPTDNAGRRRAQKMYKALKCQKCGAKQNLQRHHKDGNPKNNQPTNVSVLCWRCHMVSHGPCE